MWNTRLKAFGNFLTAACMVMPCWGACNEVPATTRKHAACIVSKLVKEFRLVACMFDKQSSWVILSRNNCHGPIDS